MNCYQAHQPNVLPGQFGSCHIDIIAGFLWVEMYYYLKFKCLVNITDFDNIFSAVLFPQLNIYAIWVLLWNVFLAIFWGAIVIHHLWSFCIFCFFNICNVSIFEFFPKNASCLDAKYILLKMQLCLIIKTKITFKEAKFLFWNFFKN